MSYRNSILKKLCVLLISSVLILSLAACGKAANVKELSEFSISDNSDFKLELKENSISKTGGTFILTNDSKGNCYYGTEFSIQVKKDDGWHKLEYISDNVSWNLPLFWLEPKTSKELDEGWKNIYGELPKGTYRYVKLVSSDDKVIETSPGAVYIAAEFEIR